MKRVTIIPNKPAKPAAVAPVAAAAAPAVQGSPEPSDQPSRASLSSAGRGPDIKIGNKCIPQDPANADFHELCQAVRAGTITAPKGLVLPD